MNDPLFEQAEKIQQRARRIVETLGIVRLCEEASMRINLVGSLRTGLLYAHRDIDFHYYSDELDVQRSFRFVGALAAQPNVGHVEFVNLSATSESCLQWQLKYEEQPGVVWQIDLVHLAENSPFNGFFEHVADRIVQVMTPAQKRAILNLKAQVPEELHVPGVAYYQAVLSHNITDYQDFMNFYKSFDPAESIHWCP